MRAAKALMLVGALALVLASCGGGDSGSNGTSSTVQSGATASGPGAADGPASGGRGSGSSSGASGAQGAAGGRSGGKQGSPRARQRSKALSRRPVLRNTFSGTANVVYHEARGRCLVVPTATLRRAYHASSGDPAAIARAYADREAPIPAYRKAATAGCLDGINSRPR